MTSYLLRRAVHALVILILVSLLSFLMARLAPGSFFDDLALNPRISNDTIAALKARYGVDSPFATRYFLWLSSVFRGDLGTSLTYQRPASDILLPRAMDTLRLTTLACLLTWLFALPLAVLCAARPGRLLDRTLFAASATLLAIPELLAALLLLFAVVRLGLLGRIGGMLLPAVVLIAGAFPVVFKHSREALATAAAASYIRAAHAHGIRGARLWLRFIGPAAANPLISLFGLSIGGLASSSLLVEAVLSRPGLGPLFLDAISARDIDVVIAVVLFSAAFLIVGNLFADILLFACDPRIRTEERS